MALVEELACVAVSLCFRLFVCVACFISMSKGKNREIAGSLPVSLLKRLAWLVGISLCTLGENEVKVVKLEGVFCSGNQLWPIFHSNVCSIFETST